MRQNDVISLESSWESHFRSFVAKPNDLDQCACDSIAVAICDFVMGKKTSPRRLLELALNRLGVDPDKGPEDGPAGEVVIDRLIHAAWSIMAQNNYQVVHTAGEPFLFHSIDRNGVIVRVSEAWAALLGYEPSEMLGRKSVEFLTQNSLIDAKEKYLPAFFRDGHITDARYDFCAKDGSIISVSMSATAEFNENGDIERSIAVLTRA